MKTVMMMILALTSTSAMANDGTLLSFTYSNGSVAPAFHRTQTCNISATSTHLMSQGPTVDFPHEMSKETIFTQTIPNVTVLKSLISEAAQHETAYNPARIGGQMSRYTAPMSANKELVLLVMDGDLVQAKNPSTAAAELVDFIKLNCTIFTIQ